MVGRESQHLAAFSGKLHHHFGEGFHGGRQACHRRQVEAFTVESATLREDDEPFSEKAAEAVWCYFES